MLMRCRSVTTHKLCARRGRGSWRSCHTVSRTNGLCPSRVHPAELARQLHSALAGAALPSAPQKDVHLFKNHLASVPTTLSISLALLLAAACGGQIAEDGADDESSKAEAESDPGAVSPLGKKP